MTDAELVKFATEFREGVLDGGTSNMKCAMVCWPLSGLLGMYGVECEAVESDLGHMNHIWLRLPDGRALDPTLDQFNFLFNENWPQVYLGPPTKYHPTDTGSVTVSRYVKVTIENREDGGVNVSSDDLPGLILSGNNRMGILAAIEPAARAILERKGEVFTDVVIDACFVAPAQDANQPN